MVGPSYLNPLLEIKLKSENIFSLSALIMMTIYKLKPCPLFDSFVRVLQAKCVAYVLVASEARSSEGGEAVLEAHQPHPTTARLASNATFLQPQHRLISSAQTLNRSSSQTPHIHFSRAPHRLLALLPQHPPLFCAQVKRSCRMLMRAMTAARTRASRQRMLRFSKAAGARSVSPSCALWGKVVQARRRWRMHCAGERSQTQTAPLVFVWSGCRSQTSTCGLQPLAAGLFWGSQTAFQATLQMTK